MRWKNRVVERIVDDDPADFADRVGLTRDEIQQRIAEVVENSGESRAGWELHGREHQS